MSRPKSARRLKSAGPLPIRGAGGALSAGHVAIERESLRVESADGPNESKSLGELACGLGGGRRPEDYAINALRSVVVQLRTLRRASTDATTVEALADMESRTSIAAEIARRLVNAG